MLVFAMDILLILTVDSTGKVTVTFQGSTPTDQHPAFMHPPVITVDVSDVGTSSDRSAPAATTLPYAETTNLQPEAPSTSVQPPQAAEASGPCDPDEQHSYVDQDLLQAAKQKLDQKRVILEKIGSFKGLFNLIKSGVDAASNVSSSRHVKVNVRANFCYSCIRPSN